MGDIQAPNMTVKRGQEKMMMIMTSSMPQEMSCFVRSRLKMPHVASRAKMRLMRKVMMRREIWRQGKRVCQTKEVKINSKHKLSKLRLSKMRAIPTRGTLGKIQKHC